MKIAAILVAAGAGTRFGGAIPKQFLPIAGKPVIRHAAEALIPHTGLIQPVGDSSLITKALAGIPHLPPVPGGAERQHSVRAGLEALAPHAPDIVLIHDAARPNISAPLIKSVIAALSTHQGAIPAVRVTDTIKHVEAGLIEATIPREKLYRAQTPQGFHFQTLLTLHRAATSTATDDAALMEAAAIPVAITAGSEQNIKITTKEDFSRVEQIIQPALAPRIGTGFDVHAFAENRELILCGCKIPFEKGLAGHSDADVGIHALCDAIYGALAEGDIGRHFPPNQATWKDADSSKFLIHAATRITARGGYLSNADITLICERPKITPHAPAMIARIAELLSAPQTKISIKATTTEQLGFTGRGEGIAAQASVLLMIPVIPA